MKIRNNLKEFSPTEALYVSRVQGCDFLFCVGSDVDNGDGFTNGRNFVVEIGKFHQIFKFKQG